MVIITFAVLLQTTIDHPHHSDNLGHQILLLKRKKMKIMMKMNIILLISKQL